MGSNALASTTGNQNVGIGSFAGDTFISANANTSGVANTFLGYASGPGTPTQLTNATAIGANALVSQRNAVLLGDGSRKVGIGVGIRTQALNVEGSITPTDFNSNSSGRTNLAASSAPLLAFTSR